LRRHFFLRFFDSDLLSSPGQWRAVAIGIVAVLLSFGIILIPGLFKKYLLLARLPTPKPYHLAMLGDILGLILLVMTLTGIFTAIQWHSLFPGLRDYQVLAAYPISLRDLFAAKFTALLAFGLLLIVSTTLAPSVLLPAVFAGDYAGNVGAQIPAIFVSASLAALFMFFSLVALQGVLLNAIPVRHFTRISLAIQGTLLTTLLAGYPLALSLVRPSAIDHPPQWAIWLPPAWYLGLDQLLAGNSDPFTTRLAELAVGALIAGGAAAVGTYCWGYKRHRLRLVESAAQPASRAHLSGCAFAPERIIRDPRQLAVFAFIGKTLARSSLQRLVLTVFVAVAAALICNSFASLLLSPGMHRSLSAARALRQAAVAAPLALSLFVLSGLRYLFRLPVEHRANWIFRVNQAGNEASLLAAVERFLVCCAVAPVALLTLPIELEVLGAAAGFEAAMLCALPSLILMEVFLVQSQRIPFTSSYLPGQRPVIQLLLIYGAAVSLYVSSLAALIESSLANPATAICLFVTLLGAWLFVRGSRKQRIQTSKLEFEELEEPVIFSLGLKRE
jgi:hypothetical protein